MTRNYDPTPGDWALIAQEMAAAAERYERSADRLSSMQKDDAFRNAIDSQVQMARWCRDIARRADENAPGLIG